MRRIWMACVLLLSLVVLPSMAGDEKEIFVVHTSDTHSCIEPLSLNFPDTAQANKGGYLRRAALLRQLRQEHPNNLVLLDCGDFSQGSVYYNLFKGDVEISLMNEMGYEACTIGNHEFDFGLENMARLFRMAKFPVVCCNYDFKGTPCVGLVKPYTIIERAGVRIGVFGVSPRLDGLVAKKAYGKTKYRDPIKSAQPVVDHLRNVEHCDIVICLSHLGFVKGSEGDEAFIAGTHGIDLVLGGHSHTYFTEPKYLPNSEGQLVPIEHMGKNARFVGTLDLTIEK